MIQEPSKRGTSVVSNVLISQSLGLSLRVSCRAVLIIAASRYIRKTQTFNAFKGRLALSLSIQSASFMNYLSTYPPF